MRTKDQISENIHEIAKACKIVHQQLGVMQEYQKAYKKAIGHPNPDWSYLEERLGVGLEALQELARLEDASID